MNKPLPNQITGSYRCADSAEVNNLLLALLNDKLEKYGVITSFSIDSNSKSIALEVELRGDGRPISIRIEGYMIEPDGDCSLLTIGEISCSKKWVQLIVKKFLAKGKLPIPLSYDILRQIL